MTIGSVGVIGAAIVTADNVAGTGAAVVAVEGVMTGVDTVGTAE